MNIEIADGLVLQHQDICSNSAEYASMRFRGIKA